MAQLVGSRGPGVEQPLKHRTTKRTSQRNNERTNERKTKSHAINIRGSPSMGRRQCSVHQSIWQVLFCLPTTDTYNSHACDKLRYPEGTQKCRPKKCTKIDASKVAPALKILRGPSPNPPPNPLLISLRSQWEPPDCLRQLPG